MEVAEATTQIKVESDLISIKDESPLVEVAEADVAKKNNSVPVVPTPTAVMKFEIYDVDPGCTSKSLLAEDPSCIITVPDAFRVYDLAELTLKQVCYWVHLFEHGGIKDADLSFQTLSNLYIHIYNILYIYYIYIYYNNIDDDDNTSNANNACEMK